MSTVDIWVNLDLVRTVVTNRCPVGNQATIDIPECERIFQLDSESYQKAGVITESNRLNTLLMEGESLNLLELVEVVQVHTRVTLCVLVTLTDGDESLALGLGHARKLNMSIDEDMLLPIL